VFQTIEFVGNSLVIKSSLKVCTSCWSTASTTISRVSSEESATVPKATKQGQDNNDCPPVISPAVIVTTILSSCYRCDICHAGRYVGIKHSNSSLKIFIYKRESFSDCAHKLSEKRSRFVANKKETLPK